MVGHFHQGGIKEDVYKLKRTPKRGMYMRPFFCKQSFLSSCSRPPFKSKRCKYPPWSIILWDHPKREWSELSMTSECRVRSSVSWTVLLSMVLSRWWRFPILQSWSRCLHNADRLREMWKSLNLAGLGPRRCASNAFVEHGDGDLGVGEGRRHTVHTRRLGQNYQWTIYAIHSGSTTRPVARRTSQRVLRTGDGEGNLIREELFGISTESVSATEATAASGVERLDWRRAAAISVANRVADGMDSESFSRNDWVTALNLSAVQLGQQTFRSSFPRSIFYYHPRRGPWANPCYRYPHELMGLLKCENASWCLQPWAQSNSRNTSAFHHDQSAVHLTILNSALNVLIIASSARVTNEKLSCYLSNFRWLKRSFSVHGGSSGEHDVCK